MVSSMLNYQKVPPIFLELVGLYLFLGSPQFRVKSLCHFPWSKQNPWMLSGHLGASMKLAVRGGILKICMVPKRLEIQLNYSSWEKERKNRGKILLKMGCRTVEKEKQQVL